MNQHIRQQSSHRLLFQLHHWHYQLFQVLAHRNHLHSNLLHGGVHRLRQQRKGYRLGGVHRLRQQHNDLQVGGLPRLPQQQNDLQLGGTHHQLLQHSGHGMKFINFKQMKFITSSSFQVVEWRNRTVNDRRINRFIDTNFRANNHAETISKHDNSILLASWNYSVP